jgi:hypothetical protein
MHPFAPRGDGPQLKLGLAPEVGRAVSGDDLEADDARVGVVRGIHPAVVGLGLVGGAFVDRHRIGQHAREQLDRRGRRGRPEGALVGVLREDAGQHARGTIARGVGGRLVELVRAYADTDTHCCFTNSNMRP